MDPEIRRRIDQVKIDMMDRDSGSTFFSALLSYLKIEIDDTQDTAWTDAISIGLNSKLVLRASVDELRGVFMHELGHVIYDHVLIGIENKDWMDHEQHNIAGDHYINLENKKNGFILPHWIDPYQDPMFTGWSTMRIYNYLMAQPPPPKRKPNSMGGDLRLPKGMPKEEYKERVIGNIVKATMQAEMSNDYGSIPGHIARIVKEVLNPKLPWEMILANYMSAYSFDDYSMRRPNRKYMPEFYLPSLQNEGMGHMIVAGDVSGSITPDQLNIAMSETRYIWDTLQPETLRLISFDTKIHFNEVYTKGDELPLGLDLKGGGGTNVLPILKYVREEDPKLCLIFTDGGFQMPDLQDITSDIFWIIKGCPGFNPPHGTVIHME